MTKTAPYDAIFRIMQASAEDEPAASVCVRYITVASGYVFASVEKYLLW